MNARVADNERAAPPLWVAAILLIASLRVLGGAAGFAFGPSEAAATRSTPFPAWINLAQAVAYGAGAAILLYGSRRDRRALYLGAHFLLVASAFSSRLLAMLEAVVPAAGGPAIALLGGLRVEAFMPAFLWLFVRDFPRVPENRGSPGPAIVAFRVSAVLGVILCATNTAPYLPMISKHPAAAAVINFFSAEAPWGQYWNILVLLTLPALPYAVWRRRLSVSEERSRVGWFLAALLAGSLPILVDLALESLIPSFREWMSRPSSRRVAGLIIFSFMLSVPVTTSYAVLIRRVLDVRLAVRKALQYALARYTILGVTASPYIALAIFLFHNRSESVSSLLSGSRAAVLVLTTAAGIAALRSRGRILEALDRRFFRERHHAHEILAGLAEQVRTAATPGDLARLLRSEVDRAIHVRSVDLLSADARGRQFSSTSGKSRSLGMSSSLAVLIGCNAEPLEVDLQNPLSPLRRLPAPERNWLLEGGVRLVVPLIASGGHLLGLITLGEKRSELPFSSEDRLLLTAIAAAGALALENRIMRDSGLSGDGAADTVTGAPAALPGVSRLFECSSCRRVYAVPSAACAACGAALGPSPAPAATIGKFRFERRLGAGGMGMVYLARDLQLERPVALKFLHPEASQDSDARERFVREARAACVLDHPNIGTIYDVFERERQIFIVMAYYEGETLKDRIRRGSVAVSETAAVLRQASVGLAAAHAAGVVHRDLKPANLMLRPDGQVKILDFGLAKLIAHDESETSLTEAGAMLGTVAYMSPEQARADSVDHRTDLWSLGVVAYEMLTGRNPFDAGNKPATIGRILTIDPQPVAEARPDTPPALAALIDRLLQKAAPQRVQSATEVLAALG